jgi:hypothetical protein
VATLLSFGCGTHAILNITAPANAVAGSPFTITVTAMVGQGRDTVINSSIVFTSSDSKATLPPRYYFTATDAGSHTFPNGVTLVTPGKQSITATVIGAPGIDGTTSVTVSPATTAMRLKISVPRDRSSDDTLTSELMTGSIGKHSGVEFGVPLKRALQGCGYGWTAPLVFIDGSPVLAEMYGTPSAITASGNSQPVASTPAPETVPMVENPPSDTGATMLLLLTDCRTSCPIDPIPMSSSSGVGG